MRIHNLPEEYKEFAIEHTQYITKAEKGVVNGLIIPTELEKSLKEGNLPNGF